ncbi:RNA polymerase sigma factor [Kitasatospora sp. NPDC051853]|uniref:RNA polymerase sigma factor n=1 Tax=Kitasatospora sp. NPDC051853 TaxID=3364058 RepID=UPI0037A4B4E2
MSLTPAAEDLLRELAPQVLGALLRRYGTFDSCEDAVQEALLAAALQWPAEGLPENPRGWLVTVASRRLVDQARSESARRDREDRVALATPQSALLAPAADLDAPAGDDSLALLFLCCHPALSRPSRVALTLRAVGGLTTAQIAAAFLVPEATMAQRISRAKQTVRDGGADLRMPTPAERAERLGEVLRVLYLVFNEGYTSTGGDDLTAPDLSAEALRLTRLLLRLVPDETEAAGLLALMLLTEARRPARTGPAGELVPLADQDRSRWDASLIAEGVELLEHTLPLGRVGPYQVQAAIAAVHAEAARVEDTDWPQVLVLYDLLEQLDPGPMVSLNRAVALAEVAGPEAALAVVDGLATDKRLTRHHRLLATRAHLLERLGRTEEAATAYAEAARRTSSAPEQRHLRDKATLLGARGTARSGRP